MIQIVLDAEKIFTTSEKILTALIGALFGFGTKALYDIVIEKRRRQDIRERIFIDLLEQEQTFIYMCEVYKTYEKFILKEEKELIVFASRPIDLSNYKANKPDDYYKAFNIGYYRKLLSLYHYIENYSKQTTLDIYSKYYKELDGKPDTDYDKITKIYAKEIFFSYWDAETILSNIHDLMELHSKRHRFKRHKEFEAPY